MPTDRPAVLVTDVSKTFRIPLEASNGIKQGLINFFKQRKGYREFSPLQHVSFEVAKGEFFGIVGRNGSGKSTLLKTLAGIYSPNTGSVQVDGTLVPFIELGVGFNPELTGRENVFLNGALLGFSRKEMEEMYDEIVSFAELRDFMDERLKNYSSGMQVRLAFSIAIKAQGDILLLDEVLAVGDAAFQQKCFDYFEELKARKKTVILVTHDMSAVLRFCTKVVLIHDGKIDYIGSPKVAVTKYVALNMPDESTDEAAETVTLSNPDVTVVTRTAYGVKQRVFDADDTILFDVSWTAPEIKNVGVAIIKSSGEYIYATNTYTDNFSIDGTSVVYTLAATLAPGEYNIMIGLFGKTDKEQLTIIDKAEVFSIKEPAVPASWEGMVHLKSEWGDQA